jgi:SAM-dependent methyltransferase
LWNIIQSMMEAGLPRAPRILDFPSGFGRVTRYIRAAFPDSELFVGDVWTEAVTDCAATYGAQVVEVTPDLRDIQCPQFDVIYCGSLLTHFPESRGKELLDFFVEHLNPGGIAIVSCSGRKNLEHERTHFNTAVFGDTDTLARLTAEYYAGRYAYIDYPGQEGYGRSFTPLPWFSAYVRDRLELRLARFAERSWDDNQDMATIQRMS